MRKVTTIGEFSGLVGCIKQIISEINNYTSGLISKDDFMNSHLDLLLSDKDDKTKTYSLVVRILSIPNGGSFDISITPNSVICITNNNKHFELEILEV